MNYSRTIRLPTLGWIGIAGSEAGLRRLVFAHRSRAAAAAALELPPLAEANESPEWIDRLAALLGEYASGTCVDFLKVPLDLGKGTAFQQAVFASCRRIPYGQTRSYQQIAEQAGSPGAARAVGNQMARNPVPIVVPCHRVVGSGKQLGGYSAPGGLETKCRLLRLEGAAAAN